jgi:hypothetical protein
METETELAQNDAEIQHLPHPCQTQTPADVKQAFLCFIFQNYSAGIHFYTGLENFLPCIEHLGLTGCLNFVSELWGPELCVSHSCTKVWLSQ